MLKDTMRSQGARLSLALLLLGAGMTGVGAAPLNHVIGGGVPKLMAEHIIASCAPAAGLDFVVVGNGAGETYLSQGTQAISPMSRFLRAGIALCNTKPGGNDLSHAQGNIVAFDGVALGTGPNQANCGDGLANGTLLAGAGSDGFDVFHADGTPALGCTGCQTGTNHYAFKPPGSTTDAGAGAAGAWKDVLRLIYFGLPHTIAAPGAGDFSAQDCGGDVRRSLVDNYASLFRGGCNNPEACSGGLQHAFRRDDLSSATEDFITFLGGPPFPNATASGGSGLGSSDGTSCTLPLSRSSSGACGFQHNPSPFCNGRELEDRDPIRRACFTPSCARAHGNPDGSNNTDCSLGPDDLSRVKCVFLNGTANSGKCYGDAREDSVCGVDGQLGLVLPILMPDKPDLVPSNGDGVGDSPNVDALFSMPSCGASNRAVLFPCGKYTDYKTQAVLFQCPDVPVENGTNIAGFTFTPSVQVGGVDRPCWCDGDPNKCKTVFAPVDHRAFNLVVRRANFQVVNNVPAGAPFGKPPAAANLGGSPPNADRVLGLGAANYPPDTLPASVPSPFPASFPLTRFYPVISAYWRLRGATQKPDGARCALDTQARQIACLASTLDCSLGYSSIGPAGVEAGARTLLLDGIALTNASVQALTYPIATPLYLNSLKGLQGCSGAGCVNISDPLERGLASGTPGCYGDLATVESAAIASEFLPVSQLDCRDFDETLCNSLPGCALDTDCGQGRLCTAGACSCSVDADCPGGRTCVAGACTFVKNSHSCCGDGVVTPAEGETCEPPGSASCDNDCHALP